MCFRFIVVGNGGGGGGGQIYSPLYAIKASMYSRLGSKTLEHFYPVLDYLLVEVIYCLCFVDVTVGTLYVFL